MKVSPSKWLVFGLLTAASVGCNSMGRGVNNLPPSERLMHPGPGVGGPGPGVMMMPSPSIAPASGIMPEGGMVGGDAMGGGMIGADCGPGAGGPGAGSTVQVLFGRPQAMHVRFDTSGGGNFDAMPLVTPARQNFSQGGIYRLKMTDVPGHEGVELYPTLELGPGTVRTAAFLAHNAIPVQFTDEDLDQVATGNFVTKVLYLPDPEFQELALAGVETLVSTRLDPGLDPIVEADRRGTILAIIRVGNKDMEMPGFDTGSGGEQVIHDGVMPASYQPSEYPVPVAYQSCLDGSCGDGNMMSGVSGPRGIYGAGDIGMAAQPMNLPPGGLPHDLLAQGYPPQYGMPITGTPIGLPGPPHIPLGAPAGLQRHVIKNHTRMRMPDPTRQVKIHVKQRPGLSYPQPANRAWVTEDTIHPQVKYPYRHFGVQPKSHVHYNGR
ncbi:MAG: hypothetical protein O2931_03695 [Planctomycetota bacterium]|nr:hypothetical protein [Planctomycetota bacterium]MDA1177881.1 hypothetical protein [Planctomycetota bacterium]